MSAGCEIRDLIGGDRRVNRPGSLALAAGDELDRRKGMLAARPRQRVGGRRRDIIELRAPIRGPIDFAAPSGVPLLARAWMRLDEGSHIADIGDTGSGVGLRR